METKTEKELLYQLTWSDICGDYPADALYEALTERLDERIDIEEMEMRVILDEIAERLGERDDFKRQIVILKDQLEAAVVVQRRLKDATSTRSAQRSTGQSGRAEDTGSPGTPPLRRRR